jgi:tRNA 2-selenouridine synthase
VSLTVISASEALADLGRFDAIVDARSESEYAEDRLPGALNWPSLDDAERIAIGTLYKQVSPFAARKRGAVLVARNIATHVERHALDKAHGWTPLVYCWRGGKRSGALATVLDQIGFRVHLLEGGYREYRRAVVAQLETLPAAFAWRVVCGPTGSGKSRLLAELSRQGAQVLDLETLANHRGSVLGLVPGSSQPSQKEFDSRVWDALRRFDPALPVFVESESKKVGDLRVPEALIERMRAAPCLWLELPLAQRVALLIEDYDFFVRDCDAFCARLDALRVLRGNGVVAAWQEAARAARTAEVVEALLVTHYDPIYLESMRRNFPALAAAGRISLSWDGSAEALVAAARRAAATP